MKALLWVLAANLSGYFALVMVVSGWITRIIFVLFLLGLGIYSARRYEKHHRSEQFDDKLTGERMIQSQEWLLEKWKGGEKHKKSKN